jgi:hypothetical protein
VVVAVAAAVVGILVLASGGVRVASTTIGSIVRGAAAPAAVAAAGACHSS